MGRVVVFWLLFWGLRGVLGVDRGRQGGGGEEGGLAGGGGDWRVGKEQE